VESLALSPNYVTDKTLFAGAYSGSVFKSTDRGSTWNDASPGLPSKRVQVLAVSPNYASDQTLFAGIYQGGVFKSTNGGDSWSAANSGITNMEITALAISPGYATDRTLYAGTYGGGIFKSTNGGDSWGAANNEYASHLYVLDLVLSPDYVSDGTLYASFSWVYVSTDRGGSWTKLGTTLPWNRYAPVLEVAPDSPQTVFAGTDGQSLWRYTSAVGPTPTPTATATPTCENVLPHGDFEAGLLPPWGSVGGTQVTTARAHDGIRSVRLGGANNAWDEVFAGTELPPSAMSMTLSYWWYVESADPDLNADIMVVVVGDEGDEMAIETITNSSPRNVWHQSTFDMGSYAGQFTGVTFHAETSEESPTSFYVDDVQVQVCGARQRVYLPIVLKSYP